MESGIVRQPLRLENFPTASTHAAEYHADAFLPGVITYTHCTLKDSTGTGFKHTLR